MLVRYFCVLMELISQMGIIKKANVKCTFEETVMFTLGLCELYKKELLDS